MQHQLAHELSHYEFLRERLAAQFPEADEETLLDTLEGMTELHEMIAAVVRARFDDLTLVAALKSRISDMQERLSRIGHRAVHDAGDEERWWKEQDLDSLQIAEKLWGEFSL